MNKTPTYSITRVSSDKEKAYNSVNDACKEIEDFITKFNGAFSVVSKAKLYGEKSKFSLLSTADDEFSGESSEQ